MRAYYVRFYQRKTVEKATICTIYNNKADAYTVGEISMEVCIMKMEKQNSLGIGVYIYMMTIMYVIAVRTVGPGVLADMYVILCKAKLRIMKNI